MTRYASSNRWAAEHRDYYRAYARDYYQRVQRPQDRTARAFVDSLKAGPCMDCGQQFPPYVKQFDHLDGASKTFELSMFQRKSFEVLEEEAKKCEVVCANCHARRSHERRAN